MIKNNFKSKFKIMTWHDIARTNQAVARTEIQRHAGVLSELHLRLQG